MTVKYRSTKDIAADVRAALKAALPGWKFSVKTHTFAGGSSITLSLTAGPEPVLEGEGAERGYAQLNHHAFGWAQAEERRVSNGHTLTPIGWQVMAEATRILLSQHWDYSEPQTDYFHCNFYPHVQVGSYPKPYQVKEQAK